MIFRLIFLPLLALSLSSEQCPSYICDNSDNSTIGSTCISNSSYTYTLSVCSNSSYYCEISGPGQLGLCQEIYSTEYQYYPGETCTANSDCVTKNCTNSVCKGYELEKDVNYILSAILGLVAETGPVLVC